MAYTRKSIFLLLIPAFVGMCSCIKPLSLQGNQPLPNIVFIATDDHGLDDLGCYGNKKTHTPLIVALAADGMWFTRAHCSSPFSCPSCSVLLTGIHNPANSQYGFMHGYYYFSSFENIRSLPLLLKKYAGYPTAIANKQMILG